MKSGIFSSGFSQCGVSKPLARTASSRRLASSCLLLASWAARAGFLRLAASLAFSYLDISGYLTFNSGSLVIRGLISLNGFPASFLSSSSVRNPLKKFNRERRERSMVLLSWRSINTAAVDWISFRNCLSRALNPFSFKSKVPPTKAT